jgi:hypothetical protein
MTDDDHVGSKLGRSFQNLIGRMPGENVGLECHIPLLCLSPQVQRVFVMARR